MKIWLPDSLYRVKPLLLILSGAVFLHLSNSTLLTLFACVLLGYGTWIIVIRILWSNTGMLKTRVGSRMGGESKTHYVDISSLK